MRAINVVADITAIIMINVGRTLRNNEFFPLLCRKTVVRIIFVPRILNPATTRASEGSQRAV